MCLKLSSITSKAPVTANYIFKLTLQTLFIPPFLYPVHNAAHRVIVDQDFFFWKIGTLAQYTVWAKEMMLCSNYTLELHLHCSLTFMLGFCRGQNSQSTSSTNGHFIPLSLLTTKGSNGYYSPFKTSSRGVFHDLKLHRSLTSLSLVISWIPTGRY